MNELLCEISYRKNCGAVHKRLKVSFLNILQPEQELLTTCQFLTNM